MQPPAARFATAPPAPGSRFARPSPEKSLRSQTRFAPVIGTTLPLTMGRRQGA
jgi:hypothetical protein